MVGTRKQTNLSSSSAPQKQVSLVLLFMTLVVLSPISFLAGAAYRRTLLSGQGTATKLTALSNTGRDGTITKQRQVIEIVPTETDNDTCDATDVTDGCEARFLKNYVVSESISLGGNYNEDKDHDDDGEEETIMDEKTREDRLTYHSMGYKLTVSMPLRVEIENLSDTLFMLAEFVSDKITKDGAKAVSMQRFMDAANDIIQYVVEFTGRNTLTATVIAEPNPIIAIGLFVDNSMQPADNDDNDNKEFDLYDAVVQIEKLFAVDAVDMQWVIRDDIVGTNKDSDILQDGTRYMKRIGKTKSDFQTIEVWDVIVKDKNSAVGYPKTLDKKARDYYTEQPQFFQPNRILFLDTISQSTALGDEVYHETLVHPAMFSHPNPQRVAIIGGGEGATLREVLKHNTVELCQMIEIDDQMISTSREWIPRLNDCSDFSTTAENCFDNERTSLLCQDAFGWFMDRFPKDNKDSVPEEIRVDPFDLIIMDALDPEYIEADFATHLYNNIKFWSSLHEALTDDGILVMQVGSAPTISNPAEPHGLHRSRHKLFMTVQEVGFEVIHLYDEHHCDFEGPWSFVLACKSPKCSEGFYDNEAKTAEKIHRRLMRTKSGEMPLKFFDGDTMRRYQVPNKAWETVYCRNEPTPEECVADRKGKGGGAMGTFDPGITLGSSSVVKDIPKSFPDAATTEASVFSHMVQFNSSKSQCEGITGINPYRHRMCAQTW